MLIKDNDLLMLENLNMKVINSRQDALIKQQQEYINELEKLKRAVLEGNYINHETNKDTKQRNGKVVGEGADTTWALKKGNDWWLLHPDKTTKTKKPQKAKETFSFSKFLVACSLGSLAVCVCFLLFTFNPVNENLLCQIKLYYFVC